MLTEDGDFPGHMALPSKVITDSYLTVFIPFSENIEDRILSYNKSLSPKKDRRGLRSSINVNTSWDDEITSISQKDSVRGVYLKTFNEMHSFKIDSIEVDQDFILTTEKNNILGFETFLKISDLAEGKHMIRLRRRRKEKDTVVTLTDIALPFW